MGTRLIIVAAPQLDIAATDLRTRVAEGRPIKYQTPEAVEHYIQEHGLYQRPAADTHDEDDVQSGVRQDGTNAI